MEEVNGIEGSSAAGTVKTLPAPVFSAAASSTKDLWRRERIISNSVYGAEEADHSLIAELLDEDNRDA